MVESGRPVNYSAIPLPEAISTLKKQRTSQLESELERIEKNAEVVNNLLKNKSVNEKFSIEDGVWTIRGRNAIYSKLGSMFNNAKESIVITSTPSGLERKFAEHYGILKKARERGVNIKTVGLIKPQKFEVDSHITKDIPSRFVLVDNQALFFLTGENIHPDEEVGLWLKSPHFVNTLKKVIK
jgi:sugar-specific transcriptional regulator TrmB